MQLDLRIENARVHTMDPARPTASAIGVLHGRVVGLDDECRDVASRTVVDLGGRTLLPGFVDAHNHLAWAGQAANSLDLSPAVGLDHMLRLIADAAAKTERGSWVDVVGYDQRGLGRHLTRHDLDRVADGRLVYVIHTSGHAHLVSSTVFERIDPATLRVDDPNVVRDGHGVPTGLFLEDATAYPNAVRTPYSVRELGTAIATAAAECAAQGVTFVAEAGIGGGLTSRSPIEALAYQDLLDQKRLPLRTQLMVSLDRIEHVRGHSDDELDRAFALGLRTGFGSDRLALGATKAWLDGGMIARTAALTEPYLDEVGGSGDLATDLAGIAERARGAHAAGWQLALHAIGDRAVDAALDIIEAAQRARPRADARHRIEHCGLVRPDQLPRLAALGVVAVTQPTFLHAFGDDYAEIMGAERREWLYRGRGYLDAGVALAGSSDRPVTDSAPLRGIQFLVERRTCGGRVVGPAERLSVGEAVAAYTTGSAFACRVEDRVGSLSAGRYADLVVLDADPWAVAPDEIADIPIIATAVDGELIHGSWPAR